MFSATRRWIRRNRKGLAIGAAVVGGTYLVGQYVVSKINDARERSQLDKIAKDKYAVPNLLCYVPQMLISYSAFAADLSKTRLTAR